MMTRLCILCSFLFFLSACQEKSSEFQGLFRQKKMDETGITFQNTLTETEAFNIIQYLYFYNGGGVAVGDVNQDNLPDLFFTANQGPDQLYLNQGDFSFQLAGPEWGILTASEWSTGVTMTDVNADGLLDIYVCVVSGYKGLTGRNRLYLNTGQNRFEEKAEAYGLAFEGFSTQSAFFDYDRDGDLDLYLLRHSVHSPGSYRDTSARKVSDPLAGDLLLRNEGGSFVDVTAEAGIFSGKIGYGLGIAVGDLNQDGWDDLYIGNDFHENDFLYINQQDGTFEEQIRSAIGHTSQFSMGNEVADLNNNGLLDVMTLDMKPADEVTFKQAAGAESYDLFEFKAGFGYHYQLPRNHIQINRTMDPAQPQFVDVAPFAEVESTDWSWSILAQDFDLDGLKDIYISNGIVRRPNDLDYLKFISDPLVQQKATDLQLASRMPSGKVPNYVYKNEGNLGFSDQTSAWNLDIPSLSNGAVYVDLDRDGDLDLVVNNINEPAFIFENTAAQTNHFIQVSLKGPVQNPFGIGAKIEIEVGAQKQIQQLHLSRGFQSSVAPEILFGIGQSEQVDALTVTWPDGRQTKRTNLPANQALQIEWEGGSEPRNLTTPSLESTAGILLHQHEEDTYLDLNEEKLMPYAFSSEGPALAKEDINGDGLEDLFVGSAAGNESGFIVQNKDGTFSKETDPFSARSEAEDVCAHFFDANGDGQLDLFVGAAGHDPSKRDQWKDRLYIQQNGRWAEQEDAFPDIRETTSAAFSIDVDQDGDLDLFVGTRVHGGGYGMSPKSYLFLNQGNGQFTSDPSFQLEGMVTAVVGGDMNGSGSPQLIVAGEWMPVTMIKWENGAVTSTEVGLNGLWQTLHTGDWDQDGDLDFIAGNFGQNSLLRASDQEPLRIYVKDFDQNTRVDPILTHYNEGTEFPFAGKDELVQQLVILRRIFSNYRLFSESSFTNLFPAPVMQGVDTLAVETLASTYFENDGQGNFTPKVLPTDAQLGPIRSISTNGQKVLIAGSRTRVQPSIGRQDALRQVVELSREKGKWIASPTTFTGVDRIVPLTFDGQSSYVFLKANGDLILKERK